MLNTFEVQACSFYLFFHKFDLQEYYEFLSQCIKEDLGFKDGKPLAACVIYRCLLQWHAFESERTSIFDYIIEGINDVLKVITLSGFLRLILCYLELSLQPSIHYFIIILSLIIILVNLVLPTKQLS